jgi:hypothetical protein
MSDVWVTDDDLRAARERSYRAERVHIAERQPLRVLTRHCVGAG